MQQGSLIGVLVKRGPDVWQFRWADRGPYGKRIDRKRVIGTACQYADADSARRVVMGLLREINANVFQRCHLPITIAEVCDHSVQRELTKDNKLAKLFHKESLQSVLEQMGHPTLGQRASFGSKNDRSRVMASQFAPGEEQLCENPRHSLGSLQSCLPS